MKVLIATERGQSRDHGDYCWTDEGELVRVDDCPDSCCRCTGFSGVESHRGSTTALVVERPDLDPAGLHEIFRRAWVNGGWGEVMSDADLWEVAAEDVLRLIQEIEQFPAGTVVGRREWCGPVVERLPAAV